MLSFPLKDLRKNRSDCFESPYSGLHNAVGLYYLVENFLKQHERYEENWAILVFSTDRDFVSSSCAIGQDEIDAAVASTLVRICRRSDVLSYCDSGLFCILTRVFEGDDMVMFARKILRYLEEMEYNDCKLTVAAKFGITFSKFSDTAETFMERAFEALKKATETKEEIVIKI